MHSGRICSKCRKTVYVRVFSKPLITCRAKYTIPFIISLYDYIRNQRIRPKDEYVSSQRSQSPVIQAIYSTLRWVFYCLTRSRYRGILAASFLSLSGYSVSSFYAGGKSTYICPIILHGALRLRGIRLLNVLLDSTLLIGVSELCRNDSTLEGNTRRKRALFSLGAGLVVSGKLAPNHKAESSHTKFSGHLFVLGHYWKLCVQLSSRTHWSAFARSPVRKKRFKSVSAGHALSFISLAISRSSS